MKLQPPTVDGYPSSSWLNAHAQFLGQEMRAQGHDEASAIDTLAVALIEEAGMFTAAYTRWLTDPQHINGEADIQLALGGLTVTAYTLARQLGQRLDDWAAVRLRQLYTDGEKA